MGAGIAEIMALSGHRVFLKDVEPALLDKAMGRIRESLAGLASFHETKADREIESIQDENGIALTPEQKDAVRKAKRPTYTRERVAGALALIEPTTAWEPFSACDLVVEAVPEEWGVKHAVYRAVEPVLARHAIMASNTSGLSITRLAEPLKHRERFLGLHFFNPPTTLPLVEVIPGDGTSEETIEDAMAFCRETRNHRYPLVPVRVKECPGFLVNRILGRMLTEAFICYEDGVAPARDIDLAMKAGAGMPMGPLELADLIGIDVLHHVMRTMDEMGFPHEQRAPRVVEELYRAGRLGRKSGRGFYEYDRA